MNQKNPIGELDNYLQADCDPSYQDEHQRFKLNDPVLNKIYSEFYNRKNYQITIENKQLKHQNQNLVVENEILKQKLSGYNNLILQIEQQEKYIEALQIQQIQNRHLTEANERHIQEICRYILILEYKQLHIQQLDLQFTEVSKALDLSKLNINKQEIIIPDQIENESHLTNDDKYYVEQEYQIQKKQLRRSFKKKQENYKDKQDDLSNEIKY